MNRSIALVAVVLAFFVGAMVASAYFVGRQHAAPVITGNETPGKGDKDSPDDLLPNEPGLTVRAGYDLFHTTGAGKHFGASPTFETETSSDFPPVVIPGDVFGDGYEDFADLIELTGNPLPNFTPPGVDVPIELPRPSPSQPENQVDTMIHRLEPAVFEEVGDEVTIAIQMVDLSMQTSSPITLMHDGNPEEWAVGIRATDNPKGEMTIRWEFSDDGINGGTYDFVLPVDGTFSFTRMTDGESRTLVGRTGGIPVLEFIGNDVPWLDRAIEAPADHSAPHNYLVTSVAGLTTNFVAGYSRDKGRIDIIADDLTFGTANYPRGPGSGWHGHAASSTTPIRVFGTARRPIRIR